MSDRLKVFVSSRMSDLGMDREFAALVLEEMGLDARLYPEQSTSGESRLEYIPQVEECDILVHLVTSMSYAVEAELQRAEERGITVVPIAKATVAPGTELVGPTDEAHRQRRASKRFMGQYSSLATLRDQLRKGVASAIARRATNDAKPVQDYALYGEFRGLVEAAQSRLALVQRTSSLVIGPRRDRRSEEGRALEAFKSCIDRRLNIDPSEGDRPEIIHVFDYKATEKELREKSELYPDAENQLSWLAERVDQLGSTQGVRIVASEGDFTTALVLSDLTLNYTINVSRRLWFSQRESGRSSLLVWDQLRNGTSDAYYDLGSFISHARATLKLANEDQLIEVVDEDGISLGHRPRSEVHKSYGLPHRGLSVFLISTDDEVLLQRRSDTKMHFRGLWGNSCCTHPSSREGVISRGESRVREELGLEPVPLQEIGTFFYRATDESTGLVEAEFDHVLVNSQPLRNDTPVPFDPDEVAEIRWIRIPDLEQELLTSPKDYVPWLKQALQVLLGSR